MTMALGGLILGVVAAGQAAAAATASIRCNAVLFMLVCVVLWLIEKMGGGMPRAFQGVVRLAFVFWRGSSGGSVMGRMLAFCQMYRL